MFAVGIKLKRDEQNRPAPAGRKPLLAGLTGYG